VKESNLSGSSFRRSNESLFRLYPPPSLYNGYFAFCGVSAPFPFDEHFLLPDFPCGIVKLCFAPLNFSGDEEGFFLPFWVGLQRRGNRSSSLPLSGIEFSLPLSEVGDFFFFTHLQKACLFLQRKTGPFLFFFLIGAL